MLRFVSVCAVLLFVCLAGGCTAHGTPQDIGAVDLALSTPSTRIDDVQYLLTGPGGYRKNGSFATPGEGTMFTYSLSGIPAGGTFEVIRMQSVTVAVGLSCPGTRNDGIVVINGKYNTCPVVDAVVANPSAADLGQAISLGAFASDEDGADPALTYSWSVQGSLGTFTQQGGPHRM